MPARWQGWRRPRNAAGFARAPWEPVPEALSELKGAVLTALWDGELVGNATSYEYRVLPEGERPAPGDGAYRTRVMRTG
jgi:hypothetical protein